MPSLAGVPRGLAGDGLANAKGDGEVAATTAGLTAKDAAGVGPGWGDWAAVAAGEGEGTGVTGG